MYVTEHRQESCSEEPLQFRQFAAQVSSELCKNKLDSHLGRRARADSDSDDLDKTDDDNGAPSFCSLSLLRNIVDTSRLKQKQVQRRCSICGARTSFCCLRCSTATKPISICGTSSANANICLAKHCKKE